MNGSTFDDRPPRSPSLYKLVALILALILLLTWWLGRQSANHFGCLPAVQTATVPAGSSSAPAVAPAAPVMPAPAAAAPSAASAPAAKPAAAPPVAKIHFAVGSHQMPADADSELAAMVAWLKATSSARAAISGYHDPTGDKAANELLAKKRAFAVRDRLVQFGVGEAQLEMLKPVETTGSGDLPEARRVEVVAKPG